MKRMEIDLRNAEAADIAGIAAIVEAAFAAGIAPLYGEEGRRTFREFATADAIAARLAGGNEGWVATADGALAGYVELDGDRIRMMFVRPDMQGRGIGRRLVELVLQRRRGCTVVLASAPNADGFYRRMGFRATAPQAEENGIVHTMMARRA